MNVHESSRQDQRGADPPYTPIWVMINYLMAGVPLCELSRRVSSRVFGDDTSFGMADVRSKLREAARLVERWRLNPAAAAALSERLRREDPRANIDIETTRILAVEEFDRLAALPSNELALAKEPVTGRVQRAAVYAIAVLAERNHRESWRSASRRDDFLRRVITPEDDRRLEDLFLYRGRTEATPRVLFDSWVRLVSLLEAREGGDIAEYTKWLWDRDLLEESLVVVDPPGSGSARREIEIVDASFYAATRPASVDPLALVDEPWRPQRWWWRRVP